MESKSSKIKERVISQYSNEKSNKCIASIIGFITESKKLALSQFPDPNFVLDTNDVFEASNFYRQMKDYDKSRKTKYRNTLNLDRQDVDTYYYGESGSSMYGRLTIDDKFQYLYDCPLHSKSDVISPYDVIKGVRKKFKLQEKVICGTAKDGTTPYTRKSYIGFCVTKYLIK